MKLKTKAFMRLVSLSPKALVSTGELNEVETYDVDFDHQFLETENHVHAVGRILAGDRFQVCLGRHGIVSLLPASAVQRCV